MIVQKAQEVSLGMYVEAVMLLVKKCGLLHKNKYHAQVSCNALTQTNNSYSHDTRFEYLKSRGSDKITCM